MLFYFIIYLIAAIIDAVISVSNGEPSLVFKVIVWLVFLLPTLAVLFRRLHDIGKSGWWWLLAFIPIVGTIILIVWECRFFS